MCRWGQPHQQIFISWGRGSVVCERGLALPASLVLFHDKRSYKFRLLSSYVKSYTHNCISLYSSRGCNLVYISSLNVPRLFIFFTVLWRNKFNVFFPSWLGAEASSLTLQHVEGTRSSFTTTGTYELTLHPWLNARHTFSFQTGFWCFRQEMLGFILEFHIGGIFLVSHCWFLCA